jgi:hypothetical protein
MDRHSYCLECTTICRSNYWHVSKGRRKNVKSTYTFFRVPVYAISSWISLVSLNAAFYVDAFRDIYEVNSYLFYHRLKY